MAELNEIIPYLFLGSRKAAMNLKLLRICGVKRVLSVGKQQELPQPYHTEIEYERLKISDLPDERLLDGLKGAMEFIKDSIAKQQSVLVHCQMGRSRSASCVIAYLVLYHNMRFNDAMQLVQKKRPIANPNFGFREQLNFYIDHNGRIPSEDEYDYLMVSIKSRIPRKGSENEKQKRIFGRLNNEGDAEEVLCAIS
jgi:hypothetical protein